MKHATIITASAAIFSTTVGGVAGYFYAKKQLTKHYEDIVAKEAEDIRDFYTRLSKSEEFETPANAVRKLQPEAVTSTVEPDLDVSPAGAAAFARYQGKQVRVVQAEKGVASVQTANVEEETFENEAPPESQNPNVAPEPESAKSRNIFVEGEPFEEDDFDLEAERDSRRNGVPYVVSVAEYDENPDNHEQVVLTYFEGDETLADEDEREIDDVNGTVGNKNLNRFGHGSRDSEVVYIRNEARGMDYEVMRSRGRFSEEVLGLTSEEDDDYLAHIGMSHHRPRRNFDE